jgi:hypothetical protein
MLGAEAEGVSAWRASSAGLRATGRSMISRSVRPVSGAAVTMPLACGSRPFAMRYERFKTAERCPLPAGHRQVPQVPIS